MATSINSTTKRCHYCNGRMNATHTPAGEACYTCVICGHTAMLATMPAPAPQPSAAENKAEWMIAQGVQPVAVRGGWLVPSGSRNNVIHRVSADGQRCSCEAASNGRSCWHLAAIRIVMEQQLEQAA